MPTLLMNRIADWNNGNEFPPSCIILRVCYHIQYRNQSPIPRKKHPIPCRGIDTTPEQAMPFSPNSIANARASATRYRVETFPITQCQDTISYHTYIYPHSRARTTSLGVSSTDCRCGSGFSIICDLSRGGWPCVAVKGVGADFVGGAVKFLRVGIKRFAGH